MSGAGADYIDVHARAAPCLGREEEWERCGREWQYAQRGPGVLQYRRGSQPGKQRVLERSQRLHTLTGGTA